MMFLRVGHKSGFLGGPGENAVVVIVVVFVVGIVVIVIVYTVPKAI
jgi:hypothetical protein